MSILILIISCYLISVSPSKAARILAVFPVPSISHQVVFRPLTQELARRGHEVIVITTDPAFPDGGGPSNLTEIDVHDISYNIWQEKVMTTSRGNENDLAAQVMTMLNAMITIVGAQISDKQVQNLIQKKQRQFDLILSEACVRPALGFSHVYKVPVIQVSSFGASIDNYATIGAPTHPLLYPAVTNRKINNLTFWEKVSELYNNYMLDRSIDKIKILEHKMLKKYIGNDMPSIDELNNNVDMLFLNVHPIFAGIRPVPPTVIYMGGLHQKPIKELPEDLKSYLDASKNGVIYISFGTNVDPSLLPSETIQTLIQVFSKLPYDILWKWNKDELPGRTNNIKISKWLPQSDLLRHPKIKLFITQGGLQSTDEAITAGVPLIGMPMLADQWFNVEKYEYHKIGIRIDMESLTEEKLIKAIYTVIDDISYRKNIVNLREMMLDEPMSPLDRAVWWIEYVLRHGGAKHLRSPAANITWTKYLELELIAIVLVVLLAALVSLIISLRLIYIFALRNLVSIKIKRA